MHFPSQFMFGSTVLFSIASLLESRVVNAIVDFAHRSSLVLHAKGKRRVKLLPKDALLVGNSRKMARTCWRGAGRKY